MALPVSGAIWLSQLRDEFGNWGPPNYLTHYYRGALTSANNLGVPTAGYISLAHFYGTQKSVAGSWSRTNPGTYTFTVPVHSTIRIDVRGAGGGGGGSTYDAGATGQNGTAGGAATVSSAAGIRGNGGAAGQGAYYNKPSKAANGTGANGNTLNSAGAGSNGGVGGTYGATKGGDGGDGGRAVSDWGAGSIAVGAQLTVTVPSGGTGGAGQVRGANGENGAAYISWS